jgi:hypothetical protein
MKDNCFYSWIVEEGKMVKQQLNGKVSYLDIDFKNDIEILDFKNLQTGFYIDNSKMYIMDDNTFIFYDTQAKSFRIIKER